MQVKLRYGRIPQYRNPKRQGWGFEIGDHRATKLGWNVYTCPRRSKDRLLGEIRAEAESRGYSVEFTDQS